MGPKKVKKHVLMTFYDFSRFLIFFDFRPKNDPKWAPHWSVWAPKAQNGHFDPKWPIWAKMTKLVQSGS